VVIDAFRLIPQQSMIMQQEPRQTTSNQGHLQKPGLEALLRGLNRYYYSINIKFKCNELEQTMLQNLYKNSWIAGLK
jgi:26S proteasome regulatory subunit N11